MNLDDILKLFPLGGLLFILATTEGAYQYIKWSKNQTKMPGWFWMVPMVSGCLYGVFQFLSNYSPEFQALPTYVKVSQTVIQAFIGIGVGMIVFEFRKRIIKFLIARYFPKKNGGSDE